MYYYIVIFIAIIIITYLVYANVLTETMIMVDKNKYYADLQNFSQPRKSVLYYPQSFELGDEYGRNCCDNCQCSPKCNECTKCPYQLGPYF